MIFAEDGCETNLSMKSLICLFLLALGNACCLQAQQASPTPRNIVFILIDDQRYDFLGFLDHPWINTPHIDRLAERSVYFPNAFVTTSLCSPSRASILTGQYAHAHRVIDNETPLPRQTPTFPEWLQQAGYHTGFIGKWHMGGNNDQPRKGFDHWVSFRGQGPYFDPELNIDGQRKAHQGYTPDILTNYACQFIEQRAQEDSPYLLYLSHKSIHEDFSPAPRHEGTYKDLKVPRPATFADTEENYQGKPLWLKRQRTSWHGAERDFTIQDYGSFDRFFQRYSECMLAVDESVGRIVETLQKAGQLDETLIVYFSDNGYLMGEHGLIDKRVMYEPSIRVPCFVHCPALIPQPRVDERMVLNIDLGPTFLDVAGLPPSASMHGNSFLPLIEGKETNWRKAFVYEYFVDPPAPQTPTTFGLRTETHSYMTYPGVWDQYELYDLEHDPHQTHNLLGTIEMGKSYGSFVRQVQRQDPETYALLARLEQQLTRLLEAAGGSRTPNWKR